MPKVTPAALRRRHTQSAIVSELTLTIVASLQRLSRTKSVGTLMERAVVAMAIRLNDEAGRGPATVADLVRHLNMPRTSVKRHLDLWMEQGLIRRDGAGYVGDLAYLAARADAPYFREVTAAILKAADALRALH